MAVIKRMKRHNTGKKKKSTLTPSLSESWFMSCVTLKVGKIQHWKLIQTLKGAQKSAKV